MNNENLQADEKNPILWIQVSREKEPLLDSVSWHKPSKNQGLDTSQLDF